MTEIPLDAPLEPKELDAKALYDLQRIVRRVSAKAVFKGHGEDLLMRVYLSGLYHGMMLSDEAGEKNE